MHEECFLIFLKSWDTEEASTPETNIQFIMLRRTSVTEVVHIRCSATERIFVNTQVCSQDLSV